MKRLVALLPAIFLAIVTCTWAAASETPEPRAEINLSGHPIRGPVNAPVTIVVFSDYL